MAKIRVEVVSEDGEVSVDRKFSRDVSEGFQKAFSDFLKDRRASENRKRFSRREKKKLQKDFYAQLVPEFPNILESFLNAEKQKASLEKYVEIWALCPMNLAVM